MGGRRLVCHARNRIEGASLTNWFYLAGSVCFLIGTLINIVRA